MSLAVQAKELMFDLRQLGTAEPEIKMAVLDLVETISDPGLPA